MFISEVFAADTAGNVSTSFASFIPLILVFVVFYFLIIRPNHKKLKEHRKMIDQIKRGDTVITSGGIVGEVNKVDEANAQFVIEIAPKVEVTILKSAISQVLDKEAQKKSIGKGKVEKNDKKNKNQLEESKKDNKDKNVS